MVCLGCRNATAFAAADEARLLAADLIIQPDAIAVITRDKDGGYHVTTSHHPVTKGASWGLFWGFLFGLLFFIPDPFRSVRDLGRVLSRCSCSSGFPEGCSPR